jgi:hypothetical protein
MIEDFKNLFRHMLYKHCNILVNDLSEVIDEVSTFIHEKVEPYIKESGDRLVVHGIELIYDDNKIIWKLFDGDFTNVLLVDFSNIDYIFEDKGEYILKIKQKYEHYPKEFYNKSFFAFMDALADLVYSSEFIEEELNVFDLCILHNNGENNIIYEV